LHFFASVFGGTLLYHRSPSFGGMAFPHHPQLFRGTAFIYNNALDKGPGNTETLCKHSWH